MLHAVVGRDIRSVGSLAKSAVDRRRGAVDTFHGKQVRGRSTAASRHLGAVLGLGRRTAVEAVGRQAHG